MARQRLLNDGTHDLAGLPLERQMAGQEAELLRKFVPSLGCCTHR